MGPIPLGPLLLGCLCTHRPSLLLPHDASFWGACHVPNTPPPCPATAAGTSPGTSHPGHCLLFPPPVVNIYCPWCPQDHGAQKVTREAGSSLHPRTRHLARTRAEAVRRAEPKLGETGQCPPDQLRAATQRLHGQQRATKPYECSLCGFSETQAPGEELLDNVGDTPIFQLTE